MEGGRKEEEGDREDRQALAEAGSAPSPQLGSSPPLHHRQGSGHTGGRGCSRDAPTLPVSQLATLQLNTPPYLTSFLQWRRVLILQSCWVLQRLTRGW